MMAPSNGDSDARFDYVVVGGGSSGCVVAAELAADPSVSVLLLEDGDSADQNPETLRADGYKDAFINPRLMFERFSTPQRGGGDRRLFMGSGRGLGGSGAINAMVYTRGAEADFAEWPEGWRWRDVVPHFEALEERLRVRRREATEFTEACIESAIDAGFRRKADLNDGDLSGVLGYEWMNFDGVSRRSSYVSFLKERLGQPNLRVVTGARAHRIVFEGRRAKAIEWSLDRSLGRARIGRELVLSSGALETPKLLMLSGVGPGESLRRRGLPSLVEAPNVGKNLHDHPNVQVFFRGRRDIDCNYPQLYGFHRANEATSLPKGQSDSCYVFYPARSSFREGLIKLLPSIALPEALYAMDGPRSFVRGAIATLFDRDLVQRFVERLWGIVVILGKPKSRGSVDVASSDPSKPALVDPAYFADPEDMQTMLQAVDLARRIARPMTQWGNDEIMPGLMGRSPEALESFIRKNVMTTYHYAGTCRMGDDASSVVDTRLKLRGVDNVRVADASVIPTAPVSALNAPSMLIGLRASRFIREERRN